MIKVFTLVAMSILFRVFFKSRPEVKTSYGIIRGKIMSAREGRPFYSFTGIPYAKPPIGDLRFRAPMPADPWTEPFHATENHAVCPQINILSEQYSIMGNEDCLYLNIYTPKLFTPSREGLAVMFYIHGGAFSTGSARRDWLRPDLLMDKDIVLVTVNYRLGALGFLSTADEIVPGNNGLKDQALALRWVSENILYFGGDPNRITIFGNSAGAISTQYHMMSPLSQDLIHGAIIQSASALSFFSLISMEEAKKNAEKLAALLYCPIDSSQRIVDCLRLVDAYKIIQQEIHFLAYDNDTTMPFRPVVETESEEAFLTLDPILTAIQGKIANVPLMVGIVSHEGGYKAANLNRNPSALKTLNQYYEWILAASFGIVADEIEVAKAIKQFYFGHRDIDRSTLSDIADMYTDGWFLLGADATVRSHLRYSDQPVYKYLFAYRGSVSYCNLYGDFSRDYGICHTDELLYLLPNGHTFPYYEPFPSDDRMSDIMTTLWTNFAKTGDPTPKTSSIVPQKWHPVQSDKQEYYHIGNYRNIRMNHSLFAQRSAFWKCLPIKTNRI